MENSVKHDAGSFQYVLADYLETAGIDLPRSVRQTAIKRLFLEGGSLEAVPALQCGASVMVFPHHSAVLVTRFLILNRKSRKLAEVCLT